MKIVGIVLGVLLVLVLIIAGWVWSGRGGLIDRSQGVDEKWAQVQNVYQRRFDLVPNLVASVDNFMQRQQATLEGVIAMRQRVIDLKGAAEGALKSQNPALLDSLAGQLSRQLNSFINVVVEQYPQIKGDQLYSDLMTQLEGTENRIAQERMRFNQAAQEFNQTIRRFPQVMIANMLGFKYRAYFEAAATAQEAPKVQF